MQLLRVSCISMFPAFVRRFLLVLVVVLAGSLHTPAGVLAQTSPSSGPSSGSSGGGQPIAGQDVTSQVTALEPAVAEVDIANQSIFGRALAGGWIVFCCLMTLVILSILSWAIVIAKSAYLYKIQKTTDGFIKSFWDSRSLNDLNGRLSEYPYSPAREVFRTGYAELVRGSQLRESAQTTELAVNAAIDNLGRSLVKAKFFEKRRLEKFMNVLAITASAAPFIGLFGTVWGIMGAFEGIARTGSASLAAVAPGISEALIATAFGLAAAIPAVIGYNIFAGRVRGLMTALDGFAADFLNIVERYLVSDKPKGQSAGGAGQGQTSPL